jgi:hypothetical protein
MDEKPVCRWTRETLPFPWTMPAYIRDSLAAKDTHNHGFCTVKSRYELCTCEQGANVQPPRSAECCPSSSNAEIVAAGILDGKPVPRGVCVGMLSVICYTWATNRRQNAWVKCPSSCDIALLLCLPSCTAVTYHRLLHEHLPMHFFAQAKDSVCTRQCGP